MPLLAEELDMAEEGNGQPTLGEIGRSQHRMESAIERIEHTLIPETLRQVSDVRHRVANLEAKNVLGAEFLHDYQRTKDTVMEVKTSLTAVEKYRSTMRYLWLTIAALVISVISILATRGG